MSSFAARRHHLLFHFIRLSCGHLPRRFLQAKVQQLEDDLQKAKASALGWQKLHQDLFKFTEEQVDAADRP